MTFYLIFSGLQSALAGYDSYFVLKFSGRLSGMIEGLAGGMGIWPIEFYVDQTEQFFSTNLTYYYWC